MLFVAPNMGSAIGLKPVFEIWPFSQAWVTGNTLTAYAPATFAATRNAYPGALARTGLN